MASIVVLDYGSQYTRLITRRLRELNTFSVILGADATLGEILAENPRGVILSGGPRSVYDAGAPGLPDGLLDAGLPILGICYGMGLVARACGGEVMASAVREYGKALLTGYRGELFGGVEGDFVAWMSHGDSVMRLPEGFQVAASTLDTEIAAMEDPARGVYCVQFHPEVQHTPKGLTLLENFVRRTGVVRDWTPEHILDALTREVQAREGAGAFSDEPAPLPRAA